MKKPTLEIHIAVAFVGAIAGAALGGSAQQAGMLWLLAYVLCLFLLSCYYGLATWSLSKNHPPNRLFGLALAALFLGTIAVWVAWTNDSVKPPFCQV